METTYRCLKQEWNSLWDEKISDRWKAEDIAKREYAALFVGQGEVISASRDFKWLQFSEILERHEKSSGERIRPPDPETGGWGRFIKEHISSHDERKRRRRTETLHEVSQLPHAKKAGRGWLHNQLSFP